MASSSIQGRRILESEARNFHLRLVCTVLEPSRRPLMCIFKEMTKGKLPKENFIEYLERIKKKPKGKTFNKTQEKTIKSDVSCNSFDITLLFFIIQEYCDKVEDKNKSVWTTQADTLEYNIKSIKDNRNDVMHEISGLGKREFDDRVRSLQELLKNTWKKIEDTFGTDTQQEVLDMEKDLKIIQEAPFEDLRVYFRELQALMDNEGVARMKEQYKDYLSEAPDVHLLEDSLGTRKQTKILDVFTEMQMIYNQKIEKIEFRDWLTVLGERTKKNNKSKFILVEGVAGVGKTTLTRKIVLDWSDGNNTMDQLLDYELLIYMQFRERHIKSLPALFLSVMPTMKGQVDPEYLKLLIEGKNIIFICDGLDEKNDESQLLFKDILQYGEKMPITVMCTTRPEEIDRLDISSEYACLRIKVVGISEENRSDFITKYFKARGHGRDPKDLVNYLNKTAVRLQEHWRFPYNLMCLAMLWILSPTRINTLTTATELFEATLDEIIKKLNSRQPGKDIPPEDMEDIMETLFHVALINHRAGVVMLPPGSLQILRNECGRMKLYWENIASTFLIQTVSWSERKDSHFSFPHKGLQDFYAAKSILKKFQANSPDKEKVLSGFKKLLIENGYLSDRRHFILSKVDGLLDPENPKTIREVLLEREESSSSSNVEDLVRRSQNVLTHLVGILHYRSKAIAAERAEELVQLLKDCGITSETQWLDLLELTRCDGTLCRLIAPQILQSESIRVEDSRVQAYTSILPHCTDVAEITVKINNDPQDIPCLKELLRIIAGKQWELNLLFSHEYKHPKPDGSSIEKDIQQFRCKMNMIQGQLSSSSLASLPKCLTELSISVATTEQYMDIRPFLSELDRQLPYLKKFRLHLPAEFTDKEKLQALPQKEMLVLSLQIDIVQEQSLKWASEAASKLQPEAGQLGVLLLHRVGGIADKAIEALKQEGVRVARLEVTPRPNDEKRLKKKAKKMLGCEFVPWTPAYEGDIKPSHIHLRESL
ncbi:uncharacterized protein LOC125047303 isoform X2 [Penaeus chinensis]|uniref:uncharacterized protein LOC125047303 isoform X2 n=1 Tax=Penaeus chinensis TaxID=139456 RepID=UPI001FB65002|nr:uncharacterized protein LOC125047303 isoform X2 [Penaeus chinensis]